MSDDEIRDLCIKCGATITRKPMELVGFFMRLASPPYCMPCLRLEHFRLAHCCQRPYRAPHPRPNKEGRYDEEPQMPGVSPAPEAQP